jgi:transposase
MHERATTPPRAKGPQKIYSATETSVRSRMKEPPCYVTDARHFQEDLLSWIQSHVHALEFLGGVPQILVPDNLKVWVTNPVRYEPDINCTYQGLAEQYGTVVISARTGKPQDKAKVGAAVLLAECWILAALRNHTFFSLTELKRCLRCRVIATF